MKALSFVALTVSPLLASAPARSQSVVHEFLGSGMWDGVGACVARGPDLSGDGIDDLLIGAQMSSNQGRVEVRDSVTGALILTLLPPHSVAGQAFGSTAANAGDVDGDGIGDVIVGADVHSPLSTYAGSAYVFSGATGLLIHEFLGSTFNQHLGRSVQGLGDVDADGTPDLLVSGEGKWPSPTGIAHVYSGASGLLIRQHASPVATQFYARATAVLADLDGDGARDYAIGAPTLTSAGRIDVHSGATGALIRSIAGANGVRRTGYALANAGDVDLDGFDDLVSGSPGDSSEVGRAQLYSGASGALLLEVFGSCYLNVYYDFGFMVAGGVDVDLDGRPDFAVGSHSMNLARVYSSATGALLYEIQEPSSSHDNEGIEVALLPDVSGDGRGELAFGHQADDTVAFYAGRAAVYSSGSVPHPGGFCFGDGSAGACPCTNPAASGAGCANSSGSGATLVAMGSTSIAEDRIYFRASGLIPGASALLFSGTTSAPNVAALDGIRCAGGTLRRHALRQACPNGEAVFGPDSWVVTWIPGQTLHFQAMYRDPAGPCGTAANFTSAAPVSFTP